MTKMNSQKDLGQLLLEEGLINEDQLRAARAAQLAQEKSIGRVLVDMGLITEQAKMAFLHKKFKHEIVDIRGISVPPELLTRISRSYAERFRCVPILIDNNRLVMAMEDPTDIMVQDEVKAQTGMELLPVLAPIADIENVIRQYPALTQEQVDSLAEHARSSAVWRVLHPLLFLSVMILPLALFLAAIRYDWASVGRWIVNTGTFDATLYATLTWALWAIMVWEIDGLFFKQETE